MKEQFPQIPKYEFAWRSLQVEPVQNSGERFTLGVVVKGMDQKVMAVKLIPTHKLKIIFGEKFGGRIAGALNLCMDASEKFYAFNSLASPWEPPLDGFFSSTMSVSRANSLDEGVFRAAMHSSSFAVADEYERINKAVSIKVKTAPEIWRHCIVEEVVRRRKDLKGMFEREVSIKGSGGMPIKFGFLSENYAAQFDAISNSQSIQTSLIRAQSKLWQLDCLRDHITLFKPQTCELIFQVPGNTIELESAAISDFVEELKYEAGRRDIHLFTSSSPLDAANHLLLKAA
ncbi:MAG: hypothetical protein Q7V56_03070 [Gammaproteobacteria bacterium]|nr:hypothetical protein [Gammaproteobacteria bacterium]